VFTRKVVGWSMAANQNTELVTKALKMAVSRQRPAGVVVHHSDQGSQVSSRVMTSPRPARRPA